MVEVVVVELELSDTSHPYTVAHVDNTELAVVVTVAPAEETPKEVLVRHSSADSVSQLSGSGS